MMCFGQAVFGHLVFTYMEFIDMWENICEQGF